MQAWVVGGTSGIGAAIVRQLQERKISVLTMSNDSVSGRRLSATGVVFEQLDLADRPGTVGRRTKTLLSQHGLPTYLFVSAGLTRQQSVVDTAPEDWELLARVNLLGIVELCNAVVGTWQTDSPRAWKRHIVILGSVNAERPLPSQGAYSVMKAGLQAYAKCLSNDVAPMQIRVTVVAPGAILTPMQGPILEDDIDGQKRQQIAQSALVARWGEAEEVARVAMWIALDSPAFFTGAEVVVDGGYMVKR